MMRVRADSDGIQTALGSEHIPNTLKYADPSFLYGIPRICRKRMGH